VEGQGAGALAGGLEGKTTHSRTTAAHPHDVPGPRLTPIFTLRGKVHGSLARAGKVKSQTPKVEPQEKKKKVCGRAKKRIIYNRRFVNVRPSSSRVLRPGC
jgi:small subunit ribosomal protein S30e